MDVNDETRQAVAKEVSEAVASNIAEGIAKGIAKGIALFIGFLIFIALGGVAVLLLWNWLGTVAVRPARDHPLGGAWPARTEPHSVRRLRTPWRIPRRPPAR